VACWLWRRLAIYGFGLAMVPLSGTAWLWQLGLAYIWLSFALLSYGLAMAPLGFWFGYACL
jgi:hypothetical protein